MTDTWLCVDRFSQEVQVAAVTTVASTEAAVAVASTEAEVAVASTEAEVAVASTIFVSLPVQPLLPRLLLSVMCGTHTGARPSPLKKQKVSNWNHKAHCHFTFTPLRVVGKGNFGVIQHGIWSIRFFKTNRVVTHEVAIKSIAKSDACLIDNEIKILTKVRRLRFFTKLYTIIDEPQKIHLVLNYCRNGDLFSHLQRSAVQANLGTATFQNQMMDFAVEIVFAINALHDQHILHGDIKCENILITQDGHIELCDFGLSALNVTSNCVGGNQGSELFMSPEQGRGVMYGLAVDVWALGIVFLHMFTSVLPQPHVYGSTTNVNIEAIDCNPALSFSLPMYALIKDLLTVNRHTRPTIAQVKTHEVFRHVNWTTLATGAVASPVTASFDDNKTINPIEGYADGIFEDVFTQLPTVPVLYEQCSSVTVYSGYD